MGRRGCYYRSRETLGVRCWGRGEPETFSRGKDYSAILSDAQHTSAKSILWDRSHCRSDEQNMSALFCWVSVVQVVFEKDLGGRWVFLSSFSLERRGATEALVSVSGGYKSLGGSLFCVLIHVRMIGVPGKQIVNSSLRQICSKPPAVKLHSASENSFFVSLQLGNRFWQEEARS